ncbi:MAG: nitrilase-related carbon-nitrogen hydrolase, partial [Amphiplicatus sp.]
MTSRRPSSTARKPAPRAGNLYTYGMARLAICSPKQTPGDPAANAAEIVKLAREADKRRAALALFSELGVSSYAIDDLLLQDALLAGVQDAIESIRAASGKLLPALIVGAPLALGPALYNCAVVIHRGRILGVTPKTYLPNYREYYEKRHFGHGDE